MLRAFVGSKLAMGISRMREGRNSWAKIPLPTTERWEEGRLINAARGGTSNAASGCYLAHAGPRRAQNSKRASRRAATLWRCACAARQNLVAAAAAACAAPHFSCCMPFVALHATLSALVALPFAAQTHGETRRASSRMVGMAWGRCRLLVAWRGGGLCLLMAGRRAHLAAEPWSGVAPSAGAVQGH